MSYPLLAVVAVVAPVAAQNHAKITTPNLSFTAPGIFFAEGWSQTEVSGVTDKRTELHYRWEFEGEAGGVPGIRNGAEVAHCYKMPGTYIVNLTVEDGTSFWTDSVTVTVSDPNTIYAGAKTICFANRAEPGFPGAPPNAQKFVTSDFDAALAAHLQSGTRLLFQRADTFVADRQTNLPLPGGAGGPAQMQIGAFGPGTDRAIIQCKTPDEKAHVVYVAKLAATPPGYYANSCTFFDLDLRYNANTGRFYEADYQANRTWFVNVKATQWKNHIVGIAPSTIASLVTAQGHTHMKMFEEIGFSECHLETTEFDDNTLFIGAKWFAILACNLYRVGASGPAHDDEFSHVLRIPYCEYGFIDPATLLVYHDTLAPKGGRHAIKLHNEMPRGHTASWADYTQYVTIQCQINSNSKSNAVQVAPQNEASDEWIREVTLEKMRIAVASSHCAQLVRVLGEHMMIRNCEFIALGQMCDIQVIGLGGLGVAPPRKGYRVYNNSFYIGPGLKREVEFVHALNLAGSTNPKENWVQNNLIWGPSPHIKKQHTNSGDWNKVSFVNNYTTNAFYADPNFGNLHLTVNSPGQNSFPFFRYVIDDKTSTSASRQRCHAD